MKPEWTEAPAIPAAIDVMMARTGSRDVTTQQGSAAALAHCGRSTAFDARNAVQFQSDARASSSACVE
jgi:hypothetical protein